MNTLSFTHTEKPGRITYFGIALAVFACVALLNTNAVAEGVLYAGSWDGNIYKIASDGSYTTFAADVDPLGLVCDAQGNLYAASQDSNIYKFTPSGEKSVFAADIYYLLDIACDGSGNIYSRTYNEEIGSAIIKISPDGSYSAFASIDNEAISALVLRQRVVFG